MQNGRRYELLIISDWLHNTILPYGKCIIFPFFVLHIKYSISSI